MAELVSSSDVVDLVYEVAENQMGRNEPYFINLSNALKVAGEYNVSMISRRYLLFGIYRCIVMYI